MLDDEIRVGLIEAGLNTHDWHIPGSRRRNGIIRA